MLFIQFVIFCLYLARFSCLDRVPKRELSIWILTIFSASNLVIFSVSSSGLMLVDEKLVSSILSPSLSFLGQIIGYLYHFARSLANGCVGRFES